MTFHYALWTDLTAEQPEFNEAFDYLASFQLSKINLFTLFDFSTLTIDRDGKRKPYAFAEGGMLPGEQVLQFFEPTGTPKQ